MKNILIIHPNLEGGGAEKVLINILNNIDYTKYNVTLLLLYKKGIYIKDVNQNVNIKYIYDYNKFKYKIIQSIYCRLIMYIYEKMPKLLYKIINKNNYDTEIAFLEGEATKFLSYSSNKNSKKVAWVHVDMNLHTEESLKRENLYYEKIDEIICVSNDCKNSFDNIFSHYKEKTRVIYNLIDEEEVINNSNKRIDYRFNNNTIIAVGRLTKQKRFDVLIKAHKLLLEDGIINNLVILGDGEDKEKLTKLIKDLRVEKSVDLLGFIKQPYTYMNKADIFAISSDFEGLPLVLIEAMILGKAIVSTKCTGPTELLDNGEYGKLVDSDNPQQLKEALKLLLCNKNLKMYYEEKSKERCRVFNKNKVMEQIYKAI